MPNNDNYIFSPRGIEKWHAFSAVISEDELIHKILKEEDYVIEDSEYIDEDMLYQLLNK